MAVMRPIPRTLLRPRSTSPGHAPGRTPWAPRSRRGCGIAVGRPCRPFLPA